MNKLEEYFWNGNKQLAVHKWHHYFKIYDRHFNKFIGKNPTILEIGVSYGGSLEMWNHYFDNKCTIYGIDINSDCLNISNKLQTTNINITIGNQESREFWREYLKDKPKFDIIIDDGGHTMNQQIISYEELYGHVSDNGGIYLCEDVCTNYWEEYGGGLNKSTTFIEYSKSFIDMINFYHIRDNLSNKTQLYESFRKHTNSIHYYDSIIVLEKNIDLEVPRHSVRGTPPSL
jgi:hypothetical protein